MEPAVVVILGWHGVLTHITGRTWRLVSFARLQVEAKDRFLGFRRSPQQA